MGMKQTQDEYRNNIQAVEQKLLPYRLSNSDGNIMAIINWLKKNAMTLDGFVDVSVENIFRAVQMLFKAKVLDWDVAPEAPLGTKDQPTFKDSRQENRPLSATQAENARISIIENEEAKRLRGVLDKERNALLQQAIDFVKNYHGGRSHSQKAKQVAALKEVFDRGVAAKNHPRDILKALQARVESFDTSTNWGI